MNLVFSLMHMNVELIVDGMLFYVMLFHIITVFHNYRHHDFANEIDCGYGYHHPGCLLGSIFKYNHFSTSTIILSTIIVILFLFHV